MKKLKINEMEQIEGGLNCFAVGVLSVFAVAAVVISANPMVGIAGAGLIAPHAVKCWG